MSTTFFAKVRVASSNLVIRSIKTLVTGGFLSFSAGDGPRALNEDVKPLPDCATVSWTKPLLSSLLCVAWAVDQLAAGSPAPPIKVDGSIIVDGNHRYIAGQIRGQPPVVPVVEKAVLCSAQPTRPP